MAGATWHGPHGGGRMARAAWQGVSGHVSPTGPHHTHAPLSLFLVSALISQAPPKRNELKECLMLSIPTFFDLIATILMNVGLLYVTASVYQMMRGAGVEGGV